MLSKRVARGALWLLVAKFVSYGIGLVGTLVTARLLTPEDFGIVATSTSILFIVSAFLEMPATAALVQLKDLKDDDFNTAFTISVLRGLIVCVVLLALAWPTALFFRDERLFPLMLAIAFYPFILGFRNSYFEKYARNISFGPEFALETVSKIGAFLTTVAIAWFFRSYWAMPVGNLVFAGVSVLVTFWFSRQLPRFSLKSFQRIWKFSGWLSASMIVNQLNWQSDNLLLGRILGPVTLGSYEVSGRIANQTTMSIALPAMRSLFAAFSEIQMDFPRLKAAFLKSQNLTMALTAPIGFGLSALAYPIVQILLDERWWTLGGLVLTYLGFTIALMSVSHPCRALGMAVGQTKLVFFRDLAAAIVSVSAMAAALLFGDFQAFLYAKVGAGAFYIFVNLLMVRNIVGLTFWEMWKNNARTLIAATLMAVSTHILAGYFIGDSKGFEHFVRTGLMALFGASIYFSIQYGQYKDMINKVVLAIWNKRPNRSEHPAQ